MHHGVQALSEREAEVLRLLLAGHDAKSVARSLDLSVHTVNDRLRDARRKLGVSSSREAARLLAEVERPRPFAPYQLAPNLFGSKKIGVAPAFPAAQSQQTEPHRAASLSIAWLAGGMLVMSLMVAAFGLSHATRGSGGAQMPSMPPRFFTPVEIDVMPIADANDDGVVTLAEYRVFSEEGWERVSRGKDEVKLTDLDQMGRLGVLGIMPNAKGTITRNMYFGAIPARFAMLDLDGDGVLDSDEINGLNYQP